MKNAKVTGTKCRIVMRNYAKQLWGVISSFFSTLMSSSSFRPAMAALLLFVVLVAAVNAHKNFTVTEEAWFDVEIKDYDGIGEDYRGRFVVAMFGDKCPMTTMNFQSLAKGYKRGSVSLCS